MNVQLFQQIAEQLLQKHFGLSLNDTRLSEPEYVKVLIEGNCRPIDYINEHAADCDLGRVDIEAFYGVPSQAPLTAKDEQVALALVSPVQIMCDQPMTCRKGGARTDVDELEGDQNLLSGEEKVIVINDRYADSIIGDRHDEYDAMEIQGVRDLHESDDPRGTCMEVDNEKPQFFSVYAHCKEGGVECVGDFAAHVLAEQYAEELSTKYGWPIYDYVNAKFRQQLAA